MHTYLKDLKDVPDSYKSFYICLLCQLNSYVFHGGACLPGDGRVNLKSTDGHKVALGSRKKSKC